MLQKGENEIYES